ncbi:TniQ family protein [Shinella sp. S4-D37]|uniref:TniQ family protein n=1 Tax=Shinella sp. S4-D37 TaxID=3161999 RepID=UPI0034668C84
MLDRLTMPFSNWSIEPGKTEGALGYFARLVDDEGHDSMRVYSKWIEVNGRNIVPASLLEVVCGLPISDDRRRRLAHATPVERDGSYWLGGQRFAKRDLSFSGRRWCAACLAEKAYHRNWWDIVAVRRCPYHDLELADRDIDNRPVGWWWPRFDVTKSGNTLAGERRPNVLRRGTLAAYLLMRMGYEDAWKAPLLDDLDVTVVIDLCHLVGRLVSNPKADTIPELETRTADVGYRAVSRDRVHLVNVIARWMTDNLSNAEIDASYSVVFGWAYNQARSLPDVSARRVLLSAFRKAHVAALTGNRAVDADEDSMVSLTALAADLGMDRRGLTSLVSALGAVDGGRRGKRRLSFDRSQVVEIRREVEAMLTREEVGELLGIRSWEVSPLVAAGYLTPVERASGDAGRGLRFLRRQVDGILSSIAAIPRVAIGASRKFRAYCRAEKRPVGDVAVAVLKGEIGVLRLDPKLSGFRGLHVSVGFNRSAVQPDQLMIVINCDKHGE